MRFIMKKYQIENNRNDVILFLRKMIIIYLIIVFIIFTGFTILFEVYDVKPIKYLVYIYTLHHLIWIFGLIYFKELPIEPIIMIYLSYIIVALQPIVCIFWNSGNPIAFSWYLLVFFGCIVFNLRHITIWILLTIIVVISVFIFSPLFPQNDFSPWLTRTTNILTIIFTTILVAFFAIIYVKKNSIEESIQSKTLGIKVKDEDEIKRDKILYNDIIEYLEKNKPFKNPDFNAHLLSKALHTNVNYISKALSVGGHDDFRALLNNFRINYVKSMLDNGAMKKYTIDYIYTEAGYKYRSTFNASFKLITGMTPSEYVSQLKTNID